MQGRTWEIDALKEAIKTSSSFRQALMKLGLRPMGGNYRQLKKYIKEESLNIDHLKGYAWNKGLKTPRNPRIPLKTILVKNSTFQSFKLKKRLFS